MYFVLLANELKDNTKPPELRQLAGLMIKNGLTSTVCGRGCHAAPAVREFHPVMLPRRNPPVIVVWSLVTQDEIACNKKVERWTGMDDSFRNQVKISVGAVVPVGSWLPCWGCPHFLFALPPR